MRYLVIGLGTFGMKIVNTLTDQGAEVIAIDQNPDMVEAAKDVATISIALNSTDEHAMKAAEVEDVDAAVIALGEAQEEAILTTVILKRMGIHPIIARASNNLYAHVLKQVGADQVIIIEEQAGEDIAKQLLAPELHERIMLTSGHSLIELEARRDFIGKTLQQLDLRRKYGVNVIAIQKKNTEIDDTGKVIQKMVVNDLPGPEDVINKGDVLMLVGAEENVEKITMDKKS